jgi:hypothetical protein
MTDLSIGGFLVDLGWDGLIIALGIGVSLAVIGGLNWLQEWMSYEETNDRDDGPEDY